jgi:hypothetical protein
MDDNEWAYLELEYCRRDLWSIYNAMGETLPRLIRSDRLRIDKDGPVSILLVQQPCNEAQSM